MSHRSLSTEAQIAAKAKALSEKRLYAEAEFLLEQSIERYPSNVVFMNMLAPICVKTDRAARAIELYQASLSIKANDTITRTGLANALLAAHRLDEAQSLINRLYEFAPLNKHIYALKARLRLQQNRPRDAYAAAAEGLKRFPRVATLLDLRATAAIKLGSFSKARADLRDGLAQKPEDPYLNCSWAGLLLADGDAIGACDHLEAYLLQNRNSVATAAILGHIYLDHAAYKSFYDLLGFMPLAAQRMPTFGSMAAKGFWLTGEDSRAAQLSQSILQNNVTEMATIVYLAAVPPARQDLGLLEKIHNTYTEYERAVIALRAQHAREDRATLQRIGHDFQMFNHPQGEEAEEFTPLLAPVRQAHKNRRRIPIKTAEA